ncbi:transposase (plasmid) [Thermaerobacter sp. FW80]|uniref:transposase n=1 Tax=Thermaerobacter sp. FW80 TaxID=2546351 RepID=UPI001074F6B1|nr:transposase [Thermaerobacter sp. FW80]QBS38679.1 transposase [Thermaerobacter sp. FW80]
MLGRLDQQRNFFDEILFNHMLPRTIPSWTSTGLSISRSWRKRRPICTAPIKAGLRIRRSSWCASSFLAVWANLSDVQVCQQLRYNVLYRYFCRLGWEDAIPDDTTLVRFRQRLGEERWQRLLQRLVEQARAKGCLKGRWLVMDSSPVVAHAAARTRVQLLREGRQRLLQAVRQAAPPVAKELEALAEPVPDATYEDQDQLLQAEQERTEALLAAITSRQAAKAPAVRRVRKQVERVLKDERVASYADPEARWGHQRREKPFFGYKMHLATDETGFVLAATVTAGNASDLEGAPALVDKRASRGSGHGGWWRTRRMTPRG